MDQQDVIEQAGLLSALQALFECDDVIVGEWEQSSPGALGTSAAVVSRLQGVATAKGQTHPWALIRKTLASPEQQQVDPAHRAEMPSGINYWKREFYAYRSELLNDLPSGFVRPRCFHAQESKDECVLWLEVFHRRDRAMAVGALSHGDAPFGYLQRSVTDDAKAPHLSLAVSGDARQRDRNSETFARFEQLRRHPIVVRFAG